jgi:hypothetical protein
MIAQIFKKNLFFAAALVSAISLNAHHHSHHIQVLINQADTNFNYTLVNAGTVDSGDLFAAQSNGGFFYVNGYIYPKGTIKQSQSDYAVDRKGHALNASNSFGTFRWTADLFADVTFDSSFPSSGTVLENVRWDFNFNKPCGSNCNPKDNDMIAFGQVEAGVMSANDALFLASGMPVISTECNENGNVITDAKVYWNGSTSNPQYLIKITFQNKVEFD